MKILVFSDSHGSRGGMYDAIEAHAPQQVIHLGDVLSDVRDLSYVFTTLPICAVPGNCDGWTNQSAIKNITLEGKQILLSHGHLWGVKRGYEQAIAAANSVGADILLFGHTHTPYCERLEGGLWVMNPGSARSSYGVITIEDGVIDCRLMKMG